VGAVVGGISSLDTALRENKNYYLEIKSSTKPDIIINTNNKTLKTIKDLILSKLN